MQVLSTHPSRADLLEYAEQLELNSGIASTAIRAHIAECGVCAFEVERARATVSIMQHAAAIEPSREWRAQILLSARQVRGVNEAKARQRAPIAFNLKTALAAASLILIAAVAFATLQHVETSLGVATAKSGPQQAAVFSLDVLRQASPEERLLIPAVADVAPETPWEVSQHRAVRTLDAEIDEALEALESNPACVRAATLVSTNRERLGETLKVLYVERNL